MVQGEDLTDASPASTSAAASRRHFRFNIRGAQKFGELRRRMSGGCSPSCSATR